jgi:hypothetical protein
MVKNHRFSFAGDEEFSKLLKETLEKMNKESNVKISLSDLVVIGLHRICMEIKTGKLQTTTFLFNQHKS